MSFAANSAAGAEHRDPRYRCPDRACRLGAWALIAVLVVAIALALAVLTVVFVEVVHP